jgi:peptidoglycan/xylan/chitin deacetylase (PgdA/CDA1 family)
MYIGSVRFYKHLIYTFLLLIVALVVMGAYTLTNHLYYKAMARSVDKVELYYHDDVRDILFKYKNNDNLSPIPSQPTPIKPIPPLFGYQSRYPDLYSEMPKEYTSKKKVAYLTFDDGPTDLTDQILDILKEHDVKATFFVITTQGRKEVLQRIVAEGHTIGIHSHTHKYKEIYKSVDAFLDDFYEAYQTIYQSTSVKPEVFRFPGGSINAYNFSIHQEIISEMLRRGFLYYDWNVSTEDTKANIDSDGIFTIIKESVNGQDRIIILAHDSNSHTEKLNALPRIIEHIKSLGYTFESLDNKVEPIWFAYPTP